MDASKIKKKVKDKRIREIMWKIDHSRKNISDEEWLQFAREMDEYIKTDIPEDVARLFYPLGYLEVTTIICDGILRWRKSICIGCKKQLGFGRYSCSVYQKDERHRGGIPNEIWANENANCPYYEYKE